VNAPADLSPEEFRALAARAAELVSEHLAAQRAGPVRRPVPPELRRALVDEPLPLRGKPPAELLERLRESVLRHPMGNSSPRFFGWVNSTAAPVAIVAELLAAGLNPSVAGGDHAATYVEHAVLRWMKELLGLPAQGGALLTSGGSVANLIGLAAMRHRATRGEVRAQGLAGAERLRVYASGAEHSCVQKALELLGIGSANLVRVGLDPERRMDLEGLEAAIASDRKAGMRPACVVASAGTVDVGAIDPLARIGALARTEKLWFHVDAAYGGPAILAPAVRPLFAGLETADSVAVDPHKWMYVPVECGLAFVREKALLRDAFSVVPPYLRDDAAEPWFSEFGIQQTRGFRALKLWLALQAIGVEGYRASIERDLALARALVARIRAKTDFELLAAGPLSIACFRYAPPALRGDEPALDRLNRALLPPLQAEGQVFLTGTELDGRFALRACIVNFRTSEADLDTLLAAVRRAGSRALAPPGAA
jgi:aromatic-L-amino-acid decarboxylase